MVTYSFYETDSRVMRYAEALAGRGDDVEVFALRGPGAPRTETMNGVQVHRLQERSFNEKSRFTYAWRILLFLLRATFQVAIHDIQEKYDLVHVHSVPDLLVFSALYPRLRQAPVILDIRDILPEFYASKFSVPAKSWSLKLLCLIERISTKFATHVIVAGVEWQARLLSRSIKQGESTVMLNLPDRSIFSRGPNVGNTSGNLCLLLYHGTLNRHQGVDIAITAFARIKELVPQANFHIYGDGPSKLELCSLVKRFQLEPQVALYERIPLRQIAGVLETAQIGIVPKRKDDFGNEAFSTKTLEFMAMGVPVIVSDTKIDKSYFDDSLVRFFRGGDVEDLANCMLDLIEHPEKRTAQAERASEFVARNDWATKKQEYLDLVDRLIGT
ncbi:MAG TPA: glycosyltransferase [Candidatus Sulfotelmatobacter sp.]|nr:glycosyltransferase [Candidatus Sulfotelmatobacter sp.]